MRRLLFVFLFLPAVVVMWAQNPFGDARWIGATADKNDSLAGRSVWVSRAFECRKNIREAHLYVSGLGSYECWVNGRKANDDLMAPAWSDYDKTVFYNDLDLTDQLRKGRNELRILLGNGFYHEEGKRYHKLKKNYGALTALARLVITYENGKQQVIVSDENWRWQPSSITFNSIYGGEDFDARQITRDESRPVVIQPSPKGILRPQLSAPVRIMNRYPVIQRVGGMVFDMGQNVAGFPEIVITGQRGQQVKIWMGETLTDAPDVHVNQRQTGRPYFLTYTLAGRRDEKNSSRTALETWHPSFTYYGYRFVEIEGAVMEGDPNPENLPVIHRLTSCLISNSAPTIGSFECSSQRMNDTYRIIDRAIRSNWQHVWTDCPHREKLGWLEQDWLNGPGLVDNYDCRAMIEQTMQNIVDAQHDDGSLPEIAPEYITFEDSWAPPFQESPEWGGAIVALPFLYADRYGDSTLIHQYAVPMRRYVDYLASRDSSGILRMGLGDWYDHGPGRAGFAKNTPMPLVATAHYYRWTKMLASLPGADAMLAARAGSIRRSFIRTFHPASQAAYAIALDMGLYPEGGKQQLVDSLVADIRRHGTRLTTGDVGTPYLFRTLIANGLDSLLWTMLDHDDVPGYGAQLAKGMTTLTEQWNPDMGASRNHFMLGHINNHLIADMVGIHVRGDSVTICPRFIGGVTWAKGSTVVLNTKISVSWRIENGVFTLGVSYARTANSLVDTQFDGEHDDNEIRKLSKDGRSSLFSRHLKIKIDDEEINRMCARRHLQYRRDESAR